MWKSTLCDNVDAYMLVKGTITSVGAVATGRQKRKNYIKKLCTINSLPKCKMTICV